jgi:K+-transporting ATPase ATPase A chain
MNTYAAIEIAVFFVILLALVKPLGLYMARVYQGTPCGLNQVLLPVERLIYRLSGVRPDSEMTWQRYAVAMLLFNLFGLLAVYGIQRACCH